MSSLEELFCHVDNFCQAFEPQWKRQLLVGNGLNIRNRRFQSKRITIILCLNKPCISNNHFLKIHNATRLLLQSAHRRRHRRLHFRFRCNLPHFLNNVRINHIGISHRFQAFHRIWSLPPQRIHQLPAFLNTALPNFLDRFCLDQCCNDRSQRNRVRNVTHPEEESIFIPSRLYYPVPEGYQAIAPTKPELIKKNDRSPNLI